VRQSERRERKWGGSERQYILGGEVMNYTRISGFAGSQAVLTLPSGRGNAYDRN
jgi:hypothetical protein